MKESSSDVARIQVDAEIFVLDNGRDHFTIPLDTTASCLKMVDEDGPVPAHSADWWCLINPAACEYL
ncbi:MAG: hypothetical protein ACRC5A_05150 [Enterobacteriaceae bacterium]